MVLFFCAMPKNAEMMAATIGKVLIDGGQPRHS